jgi:hypothetical protein
MTVQPLRWWASVSHLLGADTLPLPEVGYPGHPQLPSVPKDPVFSLFNIAYPVQIDFGRFMMCQTRTIIKVWYPNQRIFLLASAPRLLPYVDRV